MMTLQRFTALADSYGADLARWPEEARGPARELLAISDEARALFDEARALDAALAVASARETRLHTPQDGADAALARLRAGVASRIAASPAAVEEAWGLRRLLSFSPVSWNFAKMATAGGFAIAAGLLVGALSTAAPAPDILMATLQPTPLTIQAD